MPNAECYAIDPWKFKKYVFGIPIGILMLWIYIKYSFCFMDAFIHQVSYLHMQPYHCLVPSHCGIEGNEIVDQLAKETLDHDIDLVTTVHFADLKPLVNSNIQQEVQIKWDVSIHGRDLYLLKPTLGPPKRFWAPDQSWGDCDNLTPNWLYQGHKIPYLVPRTTNCLPALWPDSDNWTHTPGM